MNRKLIITYSFWQQDNAGKPELTHYQIARLEEQAMDTIINMWEKDYKSGELTGYADGKDFKGWWEIEDVPVE